MARKSTPSKALSRPPLHSGNRGKDHPIKGLPFHLMHQQELRLTALPATAMTRMGSGPTRSRYRSSPSGEFFDCLVRCEHLIEGPALNTIADNFVKSAARARMATAALTAELPPALCLAAP
jgi:hypothetical protein